MDRNAIYKRSHDQAGDVILECGTHHGCTAIVLSKWVGEDGKIVTFEPFYKNCEIARKNMELNHVKNVTLVQKAVGAVNGRAKIDGISNSSVILSSPGIEVETTCLDAYEDQNPDFIKIDVEGFELQVLQGARKVLSKTPKLAIEIHTEQLFKFGASVDDLFKLIPIDNYELWIQWKDTENPLRYNKQEPIRGCVHLFGIPHKTAGQA